MEKPIEIRDSSLHHSLGYTFLVSIYVSSVSLSCAIHVDFDVEFLTLTTSSD